MRKYLLTVALSLALTGGAQDFGIDPTVNFNIPKSEAKITLGAFMIADAAYYHSDFTPLKSGATIPDARIRTSLSWKDWYLFADFGFGKGKFSQKNIFAQWNRENRQGGWNYIKAGYYFDPTSMARNTSPLATHFISIPGCTTALGIGRELGISYKYQDRNWFAYQGVFTDDIFNQAQSAFNGISVSGRWLYRPVNDGKNTLHFGLNARFGHPGGGETIDNVLKRSLTLNQALETYVDGRADLVTAELPWVNNVVNVGAEVLWRCPKFFARGEFLYKHVTKKRDSKTLFESAKDSYSWGDYEEWLAAHPLRDNNFFGGYLEAGYRIFGAPYSYENADALLGGYGNEKCLEVVARYNYTGLNDLVDGEYYDAELDCYLPTGYTSSRPYEPVSVGGGNVHAVTVGVNYSFNKYVQVMLDYTYTHLDRDRLPFDRNFNALQGRVQFVF